MALVLFTSFSNRQLADHPAFDDKQVKVARRVILTLSVNSNGGQDKELSTMWKTICLSITPYSQLFLNL
jgi:hypothetical protein